MLSLTAKQKERSPTKASNDFSTERGQRPIAPLQTDTTGLEYLDRNGRTIVCLSGICHISAKRREVNGTDLEKNVRTDLTSLWTSSRVLQAGFLDCESLFVSRCSGHPTWRSDEVDIFSPIAGQEQQH